MPSNPFDPIPPDVYDAPEVSPGQGSSAQPAPGLPAASWATGERGQIAGAAAPLSGTGRDAAGSLFARSAGLPTAPPPQSADATPVSTAAAEPLQQIGRFTGLTRLGRSDVGRLYRAVDPTRSSQVLIHLLQGVACESDKLRPLLLLRLHAAAALSHPHIAAVSEVGVAGVWPYLVSPVPDAAVQPQPLPRWLEMQGPLSAHAAALLGLQLARALAHAHAQGVLHGDLKPAYVQITPDGSTLQVMGFGLAAPLEALADVNLLGPGGAARHYMTPERSRGEPQDARADLFGAGVLLYEMLTAQRPFRAATAQALAASVAAEEPVSLQRLRPDVPPALRRIVERCLAKQPAQRYATAQALAEALLQLSSDIEMATLGQQAARGLSLGVRWAVAAGSVVAVVAGTAAAGALAWQASAIHAQADEQGRNLARFAAAQHAQQVLAEDWDGVAAQLLPARAAWGGDLIWVVDGTGVVRVSSEPSAVGEPYRGAGPAWAPARADGTLARQADGRVDFEAPVLLQGKTLGRVVVGVPVAATTAAGRPTGWLLAGVVLLAVAAAAGVAYGLATRLRLPLAAAREALGEIGKGRFGHRLPAARDQEIGQLYAAINATAQALHRRDGGVDRTTALR